MQGDEAYRRPLRRWWLSRRTVLQGAALGGAGFAAAFVGCAQPKQTAPSVAPQAMPQPNRGGIIAREGGSGTAKDTEGRAFDPHTELPVFAITLRLVYQALLGYDPRTYEVQPDLAQSWEQPAPTEYIFRLFPGVKWQNKPPANGRELEAADVVFSLNRVRSPEARFINKSVIAMVDKVEALDKTTVRIVTNRPDASALSALGSDTMVIMNPETVERAHRFATAEEVVGSGAFVMKEVKEGVAGEYVRNPLYFRQDLPYLDGVRTPFFADSLAGFAAFTAGKLDITGPLPGTQVKEYIAKQPPGFRPDWFQQDFIAALMPQTQKRPFNDPRVTRALRLLVDHQDFIKTWAESQYGGGRLGSVLPAALGVWDVPQEEYTKRIFWRQPKDEAIKEAVALLAAAGFDRSSPLRFELATVGAGGIQSGAELLHAHFRQNGQGIVQPSDLRVYESPTFARVRVEGTFEYGFQGLGAAIVEPGVWLNQIWRTGASRNYWRFSDAQVDSLIDKQNVTFDNNLRKAIVQEIVLYLMDQSPAVAGCLHMSLNAVSSKVQGFAPEGFMNGRQYQWLWLAT